MIRFILKNEYKCQHTGFQRETIYTIDDSLTDLEAALTKGGWSENGYDMTTLLGVEVIDNPIKEEAK